MRTAFLEFLAQRGIIPHEQVAAYLQVVATPIEPIGAIAFRYGLIQGDGVDQILDEQRNHHEPFGQIAIRLGLLSEDEVNRLLHVQQMRVATETAEFLALSGRCPLADTIAALGQFLVETRDQLCVTTSHAAHSS